MAWISLASKPLVNREILHMLKASVGSDQLGGIKPGKCSEGCEMEQGCPGPGELLWAGITALLFSLPPGEALGWKDLLPHPCDFSYILELLSTLVFRSLLKIPFLLEVFVIPSFPFSSYTAFVRIVSSFMTAKPDVKLWCESIFNSEKYFKVLDKLWNSCCEMEMTCGDFYEFRLLCSLG